MNDEHQLWTGAWNLIEPGAPRRNFGFVDASSPTAAGGLVRIGLPGRLARVGEDGGVTVLLTEDQGRELVAVLTRTLERVGHLRVLHRLSLLKEEAYGSASVGDEPPPDV